MLFIQYVCFIKQSIIKCKTIAIYITYNTCFNTFAYIYYKFKPLKFIFDFIQFFI